DLIFRVNASNKKYLSTTVPVEDPAHIAIGDIDIAIQMVNGIIEFATVTNRRLTFRQILESVERTLNYRHTTLERVGKAIRACGIMPTTKGTKVPLESAQLDQFRQLLELLKKVRHGQDDGESELEPGEIRQLICLQE